MDIRIFGLPHSCTNVVDRLMRYNFHVHIIGRASKHGSIGSKFDNCLVCVKNPYNWLRSYYNYQGKNSPNISSFIRRRPPKKYHSKLWKNHENLVVAYNVLNTHWLSVGGMFIKQENLMGKKRQIQFIKKVQKHFGLTLKEEGPKVIINKCISRKVKKTRQEKSPHGLITKDIKWINSVLDCNLVSQLGYEILK